jgi:hypothetical protein
VKSERQSQRNLFIPAFSPLSQKVNCAFLQPTWILLAVYEFVFYVLIAKKIYLLQIYL